LCTEAYHHHHHYYYSPVTRRLWSSNLKEKMVPSPEMTQSERGARKGGVLLAVLLVVVVGVLGLWRK